MIDSLIAKKEFDQKLDEFKKENNPSIYANNIGEIVLYEKLLELQEQINLLKEKMIKN